MSRGHCELTVSPAVLPEVRFMTQTFGSLVFTPAVKALQERYGSRRQYARMEELGGAVDRKSVV